MKKRIIWSVLCTLIAAMGWGGVGATSDTAYAESARSGHFENLGTAIKRVVGIRGTPFYGTDGTPYISAAVNGVPAQLAVLNALTLDVEKVLDIPDTTSTSTVLTAQDGSVYIGTTGTGEVYRYVPDSEGLEFIGKPIQGETHIYALANGPDGKIFGGTYPGGKLFEYDPASGEFRDLGSPVAGEKYVRKLVYDEERGLLIAGTGTNNRLVEIDPETGSVSENWMPEELAVEEYPNSIDLIGDKLFIQLNKSSTMLVMDKWSKQIEQRLQGVSAHVIPSPDGKQAYMFAPGDAYLHVYDFSTGLIEPVARLGRFNSWKSATIINTGSAQNPDYTLSAWMGYNAALTYQFSSGTIRSTTVDVPGQPIVINSIGSGPDGRIHVSGVQGGNAIYDPESGIMETYTSGMSQAEAMTSIGDMMYFGIYPQARISQFDTTLPWGGGNPQEIAKLPADSLQDRPFGMIGVEEYGKLFLGTVPQYGQLGGAFAIYDPKDGNLLTYRHLVKDQSIVTLAYKDGKIYGGTSIWGAYGAPDPTAQEGKMFIWDIASGQKELEFSPVAGKQAVTSLIVGPDGNIWGFNEGVLFIYDTQEKKVIHEQELFPVRYAGTVWRDATLLVGKDGDVYGTARGKLFRIDGVTKQMTMIDEAGHFDGLAQDEYGNLYMRSMIEGKKHELWKYTSPSLALAALRDKVERLEREGEVKHQLSAQIRNRLRQAAHHGSIGNQAQMLQHGDKALQLMQNDSKWINERALQELEAGVRTVTELFSRLPE